MEKLDALIEALVTKKVQSLCVEAGHIYVDEEPNNQNVQALKLGAFFAKIIGKFVPQVTKMLFVDDYNPKTSTLDLQKYLDLAQELSFKPDVVVFESSLVSGAGALIDSLKKVNQAIVKPSGHTHTKKKNIRLRHVNERFSCCALDAALYLMRFRNYAYNVTILPADSGCQYSDQQKNVKTLLRLSGIEGVLPLANVFFNQDGSFVMDF